MLSELLTTCGLNASERSVLLCLLRGRSVSASQVARSTGLKRPTAYAVLESLVIRDLVTRQKKDGVNHFSAIKPKYIPSILEAHAKKQFEEVKLEIEDALRAVRREEGWDDFRKIMRAKADGKVDIFRDILHASDVSVD